MIGGYLLGTGIVALLAGATICALVIRKVRSQQRRKAIESLDEKLRQSEIALVRYVMLNRQCSEEAAYQRIATFVKLHTPFDDHAFINSLVAYNRQRLLEKTQEILARAPDEIDNI